MSGTTIRIDAEAGNISIGKTSARIGLRCSRADLDVVTADEVLCGARMEVTLSAGGDQPTLPGLGADGTFESVADCKHVGITPEGLTFGLTFAREGLDLDLLTPFSQAKVRLVATRIGDAPRAGQAEDDGSADAPDLGEDEGQEAEDADSPPTAPDAADPDAWKQMRLAHLRPAIPPRYMKALNEKGITTMGKLADWEKAHGDWWGTDIPSIGKVGQDRIAEAIEAFWTARAGK